MLFIDLLRKISHVLRSLFLSGLFTIIPIAATIFFIHFIYGIYSRLIGPLRQIEPLILQSIPGSEFVLVMLLILATGVILKAFIAHSIVHYLERLITKIPLVRIVYSSAKTMVDFFKIPEKTLVFEKKVVLIPYPKKGQYHLAFLLEPAHETYEKIIPPSVKQYPEERYCKVFMPNSPNPTSGYFFIMPEDDVIPTNISFEEAIKALASCGLITPESLKKEDLKPLRP